MDFNAYSSLERSLLIAELTQGLELVKHLWSHIGPEYSMEFKDMLIQQIVTSYDKALFILGCSSGSTSVLPHQLLQVSPLAMPSTASTPLSGIESSKSDDLYAALGTHQDAREHSKKRKTAPTCTNQIKVNCGSSHVGPPADGYSWRKYGQKQILGAKHSRSYYRCTYRSVQDCWATKHVQGSDDDPNVLHITYKGNHTCNMARQSKSAPTSPAKEEPKSDSLPIMEYQQDSDIILNFQDRMGADQQSTESFPFFSTTLDCFNGDSPNISPSTINFTSSFYEPFSSSLISPTTSGSNCFSMSPCKMDTIATVQQNQQQNLEGNITEVISVANSPAIDPDFSLDPWSFSQNYPFNNL
ncbi:hypothetical protein V2J09_022494 [Rumex salicifolius]